MAFQSGFISILGFPNTGKSTLMNAFIGENLAIVNPKAQTTRHRIMGILNSDRYQAIFSDLPGILSPHYKLQEKMMHAISRAFADSDVLLLITEPGGKLPGEKIMDRIRDSGIPVVAAVNKADLADAGSLTAAIALIHSGIPGIPVFTISALYRLNLAPLLEKLIDLLPEHPAYYDRETFTDRNVRFIVSEIIREKILSNYHQEVPYSVEVVVDEYKEEEKIDRIRVIIYVNRESQKMIIIGKSGSAIKKVGTEARIEIEKLVDKKVFLELTVKVLKDWRDSERLLKRFGYTD